MSCAISSFAPRFSIALDSASIPLKDKVGTKDYTVLAFKGGHIGIYVSSRAQREVPTAIHHWLGQRAR